jgi:phospholipase/carboxylesterase
MDTSPPLPQCVERGPPAAAAAASVIWLHGLGASGHDFVPILPHLALPASARVRFVFPHAPPIPVTINMGMVMPAWYDIRHMDLERSDRADAEGVEASDALVRGLIAREQAAGVPASRIVLAGFSQGGAMALHRALRHPERLAGLLALSSYLLLPERLDDERAPANQDLPILQCHGTLDPVVPEARGREAHAALVERGYTARYETWPMQHEVCLEEIEVIGTWLRELLVTPAGA